MCTYVRPIAVLLAATAIACNSAKPEASSPTAVNGPSSTTGTAASTTTGSQNGNAPAGTPNSWPTCAQNGTMAAAPAAAATGCTANGASDVNVIIDALHGPAGAASPVAITNALYSMGIDDHTRGDYVPTLNPTFVAYLKALHPGMLRFPAGYNGQQYTWSQTDGFTKMTPALVDAFVALCRAVGAEPYMAVNIETGTLADATSLVTYANKTKGYGIKWWQIGNEPNLAEGWPDESLTIYPTRYLQYRQAMLAIDPTLKFVGLESYTGEGILGEHQQPDWFKPFLANIGTGQVDAIAWHYYPLYSSPNNAGSSSSSTPSVAHLLQETASDWPPAGLDFASTIIPYMRKNMAQKAPNAQIWIDEFAEDSGTTLNAMGYGDTQVGALWAADAMGRYAGLGTDAIFHFIFKAISTSAGVEFGYTLLDPNNRPRPEYYTFWLMANHFGENMVNASSDKVATVAAHAAIRADDCSLRVMLINKGTTSQRVHLRLDGFAPASASQYTLAGSGYQATDATLNGSTLTPTNVGQGPDAIAAVPAAACSDNTVTVKPYSVNMLIFSKI